MTHPARYVLLTAAAVATLWAAMAWAVGFDGDLKAAMIIAILCLGTTQLLEYRESEDRQQRYRWQTGRDEVWDRRDEEFLRETD
jgi:hypothetical protein